MKKILLTFILMYGSLNADLYNDGMQELIKKNYSKAMELLSKACDTKNGNACFTIGEMYSQGNGVKENNIKAVKYFREGCIKGNNLSCYFAGSRYSSNFYNTEDKKKAVEVYTIGCNNGDMSNCNVLAKQYQYGSGVKKDIHKAISLYKKVCENGDKNGCNNLATMYEYGNEAVSINGIKALEYYKKGFEADGNYYNYFQIGNMYYKGEIIKQNLSEAKNVFTKLCERVKKDNVFKNNGNMVKSCFYLGKIYTSKVKGNKQDKVKAKELFGMACDRGNKESCKEYKILNEQGI